MFEYIISKLKHQFSSVINQTNHLVLSQSKPNSYCSISIDIKNDFPLISPSANDCFFNAKPKENLTLVGLGHLLCFKASGENRFQQLQNFYHKTCQAWIHIDPSSSHLPLAFTAFSFDEKGVMNNEWHAFPNSLLSIPLILIKETENKRQLILNFSLEQWLSNHFDTFQLDIEQREKLFQKNILTPVIKLLNSYEDDINKFEQHLSRSQPIQLTHDCLVIEANWKQLSEKVMHDIKSQQIANPIEKIVISRHCTIKHTEQDFLPTSLLINKLVKHYDSCSIVSYKLNGSQIIAASPERLLKVQSSHINSDAMGGTLINAEHSSLSPQLKSNLAEHRKLLKEHGFINDEIVKRLSPLCKQALKATSPSLISLYNVYHLQSTIAGNLHEDISLFDAIEALHPTPAVAGFPAKQAQQWIIQNESYNRGWYTGGFGTLQANRESHDELSKLKIDGEISVMLRCALFEQEKMHLYAGAGFIAESDPQNEWHETSLKMQTILDMMR